MSDSIVPVDNSQGNPLIDFSSRIRHKTHNGVEHYSLVDVMSQFSDLSSEGDVLWTRTKKRLIADGFQLDQNLIQLRLTAKDGKQRLTECADAQTCLRIIQSIPSEKAEPIRQWFATLGVDRIEETIDPERAEEKRIERRAAAYRAQGKDEGWITAREFSISTRKQFTAAIYALVQSPEFGKITNDLYRGVFHGDADQLRSRLNLRAKQNPRDHFSRIALYYTAIAEEACTIELEGIADDELVPATKARSIIQTIARQVGIQADDMAQSIGIDLVTGQRLIGGGDA